MSKLDWILGGVIGASLFTLVLFSSHNKSLQGKLNQRLETAYEICLYLNGNLDEKKEISLNEQREFDKKFSEYLSKKGINWKPVENKTHTCQIINKKPEYRNGKKVPLEKFIELLEKYKPQNSRNQKI